MSKSLTNVGGSVRSEDVILTEDAAYELLKNTDAVSGSGSKAWWDARSAQDRSSGSSAPQGDLDSWMVRLTALDSQVMILG